MNNFTYSIPTKIHFGKGQISHLSELSESGNKVLLCYGGGSIKKAGIYDEAVKILKEEDMEIFELSGIAPNPKIESVREGVKLCKENSIDMVLAIGGGSVIDCAKAGADIATVPYKVLEQMTKHPLTDQGIAKFQADYKAVFGE